MKNTAYLWATVYGAYLYLLFQIMFFARFGRINTQVSVLDLFIWVVGIVSVLILMFFMRKLPTRKALMFVPFVIALPFGYVGTMGGGLIGPLGMLILGTIPFAVILAIGFGVVRLFVKVPRAPMSASDAASPQVGSSEKIG